MILYFTGTGNSKYIAEFLADKLADEAVSMNPYIKSRKKGKFESKKPFVFVTPVYLATIPELVRRFIEASTFTGNKKAYFISTCVSDASAIPNAARELCESNHRFTYMGSTFVSMPQNYITYFTMTEKEEQEIRYQKAGGFVKEVVAKITAGEVLLDKPMSKPAYMAIKAVEKVYNNGFTRTKKFIATDQCIGCAICEKNCPVNAIEMVHKKPVWTKKLCIHCMACINRCPKQAIEYGKHTVHKERFVCKTYEKP